MARQAEAERDRRAKVIHAEAEFQAAARLAEAAEVLSASPAALQLRYLQTLAEVGKGEGSTVLLPLPLDVSGSVVRGFMTSAPMLRAPGRGPPARRSA
jgi:regulator of protease activity HflC (stomatin/prohibitin superfamily)